MNQELTRSFEKCLKYKRSARYLKPCIDLRRFFRNQLRLRFAKRVGTLEEVNAFHMEKFSIVAGEVVSEVIAHYGIMEAELTGAFLQLIRPGQTVVDIGMHLGYFSTLMAQLVGNSGAVHSFEPTPSTRMISAINSDRFPNITVHPNAVWSSSVKMMFFDYGPRFMAFNSFSDTRIDNMAASASKIEVQAISIDEFREQLGRTIDVIKIDAESAEEEIVRGGTATFARDQPIVTLEVGDEGAEPGRSRNLIEMMCDCGYHAWEFADNRFSAHRIRNIYVYDNLIFAPAAMDLGDAQYGR